MCVPGIIKRKLDSMIRKIEREHHKEQKKLARKQQVARAHTSKKENTSTGSSYTDVNATGLAKLRRHLASEYFVVGLLESAHAIHLLRPPGT